MILTSCTEGGWPLRQKGFGVMAHILCFRVSAVIFREEAFFPSVQKKIDLNSHLFLRLLRFLIMWFVVFWLYTLCVLFMLLTTNQMSPSGIIKLVLILKAISTLSTACHACCTNRPPEDLKHIILMQMLLISALTEVINLDWFLFFQLLSFILRWIRPVY